MPDPMTLLKQDHREVKKLLEQLGETEPGKERMRLLDEVETNLRLHMEIEEQLLYPVLAQTDGEAEQEAETEHALTREGMQKLRDLQDQPGFGAAVEMLLGGITHHVREEETEVLPEMKGEMDRSEWMAIGDQIVAMKERAGKAPAKSGNGRKR
jgi:hemerythrin-like domain-containing protein